METVTYYISDDEQAFLGPWLKERGIAFTAEVYGAPQRPHIALTFAAGDRAVVKQGLEAVRPQVKAAQPKNPVFIVYFHVVDGDEDGWCAVGASSPEEAMRLAGEQLPELDVSGLIGASPEYEISHAIPLEEYEEDQGSPLATRDHPKEGTLKLLELGT
ncbi:hypothetical protein HPC49_29195 [Pyxidicoccus fallax]|uniref:Uncharacterized protein n=1 Tax=Pyxidicoccus fallax TaxID=394095 RepID=A0A848LJD9_9BACT|nr:hypothetical protein [Pyxidicoccus fallax]NMO17839.1 hypothetical protein [Pyxidicoccus fallax]NPC82282.1 hypothetical protein [Pyxidicoccus fallax]